MRKIEDYLDTIEEFTMEEFWAVIDTLPDEGNKKKHKENIRKYFKKDGTPKVKALSLETQEDHQSAHDTEIFISNYVSREIHLNRLRNRKKDRKKFIKEKKLRGVKELKRGDK